jgi:uncharacterized protein (UPF0332 family)
VTRDAARAHARSEWTRARQLRDEAGKELAVGLPGRAASTLYFAAVHACRALLAVDGIEPRSHRGLRSLVSIHFVKRDRVPKKLLQILAELHDQREGADYVATFVVSADEASRLAGLCDELLAEIERHVSTVLEGDA